MTKSDETRPYHHGDLSQGLVDAARRLLERDGPGALSLRAVAREAGVSPAAPYHHFKDRQEMLEAVAHEGWEMLNLAVGEARAAAPPGEAAVAELGLTYVRFALEHPALYRVMYDVARDREGLPRHQAETNDSAYAKLRATLIEAGADPADTLDLELATTAVWCSAHGLAEMAGFRQFDRLKAACGGEAAFLRGVYRHLGLVPHPLSD
jgi:AcrR family transcriptional regulator